MSVEPTVFLVEDDATIREPMAAMVQAMRLRPEEYASGLEFLENFDAARPGCVVLDIRLPHLSGIEVQQRLNQLPYAPPVIMISGHADVAIAVTAMKAGAVDLLQKPFREQRLWDAIQRAIELDAAARKCLNDQASVEQRLELLTDKEREVLKHLLEGLLNKQIASRIGLSLRTVEVRRAAIFKKMQVQSVSQLIQAVGMLNSHPRPTILPASPAPLAAETTVIPHPAASPFRHFTFANMRHAQRSAV